MSFLNHQIIQKGYLKKQSQKRPLNSISQIGVEPSSKKRRYNYKQVINPFERKYVTPFLKLMNDDDDEDDEGGNKRKVLQHQQQQQHQLEFQPNNEVLKASQARVKEFRKNRYGEPAPWIQKQEKMTIPILQVAAKPLEITTVEDKAKEVAEETVKKAIDKEIGETVEKVADETAKKIQQQQQQQIELEQRKMEMEMREAKKRAEALKDLERNITRKSRLLNQFETQDIIEEMLKQKREQEDAAYTELSQSEKEKQKREIEEVEKQKREIEEFEKQKRKIEQLEHETEEGFKELKRKAKEVRRENDEIKRKIEEALKRREEAELKRKIEEDQDKLLELYQALLRMRYDYETAPDQTLHLSIPTRERYINGILDEAKLLKGDIDAIEANLHKSMKEVDFKAMKDVISTITNTEHPDNSTLRHQLEKLKKEISELDNKIPLYTSNSFIDMIGKLRYRKILAKLTKERDEKVTRASALAWTLKSRKKRREIFDQKIAEHH